MPSRYPPPETPFAHPAFQEVYSRMLRDVVDARLGDQERNAAARALAFLLRERLVDEVVATDVLIAVHRSLDRSKVVRTLLLGLRDALGDHERIAEWTRTAADRAHLRGYIETFVSTLRILFGLRDFDGTLLTSWQLSLVRASDDPRRGRRLLLLSDEYARRFGGEARWVKTIWARFILGASRCYGDSAAITEE